MTGGVLLEMKGITKRFTGVLALDQVNISLNNNEVLAILGENGAGKSTLMKVLSGTYSSSTYDGTIEFAGRKLNLQTPRDAENAGIAMIYQEINLELDLSVAENILLGMLPRNTIGLIDWKKANAKARSMLECLNLDLDVTVPVRNLSASIQQLVCIARALVRNPKILILDEPTSALTESETVNLMDTIRALIKSGISCIYISHKLKEVFEISDRILVMRDGKTVNGYERDQFDYEQVVEDMIGRNIEMMYPERKSSPGSEIFCIQEFTVPHPYAPNKYIVDHVSFGLRKGEILGLAGLVGAGRSELLKAIFGAIPKISGEVMINGRKTRIDTPEDAIRAGLGLLTEDRKKDGFVGVMSIMENMTLTILNKISRYTFINSTTEENMAGKYFKAINIKAPSLDTRIFNLSGGNQQKVLLAKWLLTDLKVLFLDEPTRGIDIGAKAEIYKIMEELAEQGLSIVMTSSEMPELLAMCDRFIVLGQGKIQAEFTKAEATETNIMRAAACC